MNKRCAMCSPYQAMWSWATWSAVAADGQVAGQVLEDQFLVVAGGLRDRGGDGWTGHGQQD
ncbi:hypothetical protein ACFVW2_33740 [Streptomyces sp. NPDC058171]